MNRFAARRQAKSAVARTELASSVGGEVRAVTDMVTQQKELEVAEYDRSTAVGRLEESHRVESLLLENQANVLEAANNDKLPLPVYVARKESEVRIDEHRQLGEIDLQNKLLEMKEAVRLAIIAKFLSEQQKITIVQDNIDGIIRQIDQIEADTTLSPRAKQRMIEAIGYAQSFDEDPKGEKDRSYKWG